jgi:hypothetical protein
MANDADATVYSVQTTLDADKVDKAGDTMTGSLYVPTITANGAGIGIYQDASDNAILQIINNGGGTQQGAIIVNGATTMTFAITSNDNALKINNLGETTRRHNSVERPLPFAMQAGRSTVNANSNVTISLDSGRFTATPMVFITLDRNAVRAGGDAHVGNRTTSNFQVFNSDSTAWGFCWQAIQMTSTSGEG